MRNIKAATAFEVAEHIVPQLTPSLGKGGRFFFFFNFVSGCTGTWLLCAGTLGEVHWLLVAATSLAVEQGL